MAKFRVENMKKEPKDNKIQMGHGCFRLDLLVTQGHDSGVQQEAF
jgi:hypothetical protein